MVTRDVSAELYRDVREQIVAAARGFEDHQFAWIVPSCPLWSVRDLLAHQAGTAHDFIDDRLDGAPAPTWTAVHVETRKDRPVAEILDEWEQYGRQVEDHIRAGTRAGVLFNNAYVDAAVHCADLSAVVPVGRPPRETWLGALDFMLGRDRGDERGSLRVITEDAGYELGAGEPMAEVKTDTYELFRAVFGRRSPGQIGAWAWSGKTGGWLHGLARLPQTSVDQRD